jgi:transposase-like protein
MTVSSKSQVSRLREEINKRVGAFLERPPPGNWAATLIGGRRR